MHKEVEKIVSRCLSELEEYVDCCQIHISVQSSSGTELYEDSFGNYFTRKGMIVEWLEKDDERTKRIVEYNEFLNKEDELDIEEGDTE